MLKTVWCFYLNIRSQQNIKEQAASNCVLSKYWYTNSWLISHVMHAQIFHPTTLFNGKILPHSWKSNNKKKTQSSFTRTYHKTVISSSRGRRSTLRIARRWQLFSLRIFSHVFPRPRSKICLLVVVHGRRFRVTILFLEWCIFFAYYVFRCSNNAKRTYKF